MKRTSLLITLLLLLACAVRAQPYFPLSLKSPVYYSSQIGVISIVVQDSFINASLKSYYIKESLVPKPTLGKSNYLCTAVSEGFLGKQINLYGDSSVSFINFLNSPFTIKLTSMVGNSWIAYNDTVATITLKHIKDSVITTPNLIDTVKVLDVNVLTNYPQLVFTNVPPIILGKQLGLLDCPIFYSFPYNNIEAIGIEPRHLKQDVNNIHNITWDSIYNFDVQDEFHIASNAKNVNVIGPMEAISTTDTSNVVYEILARFKPNNDSLCYQTKRYRYNSKTISHAVNTTIDVKFSNEMIVDTFYLGYKRMPELDLEPGVWVFPYQPYVLNYNNNYGIVKQSYLPTNYYLPSTQTDSCMSQSFESPQSIITNYYYNGLGGPYTESAFSDTKTTSTKKLVYYRKGNKTFGIPIPKTVGLNELTKQPLATIFPNPAKQFITIILTKYNQATVVCLYDKLGKTILTQHTTEPQITLSIDTLPKGIYFYTVTQQADVSSGKIVIE
jgi:hypothetical protein